MALRGTNDPAFLSLVQHWIEENGEVFVVIRYARSAGSREYLLFHSFAEFQALLQSLPPRTDVIVFRQKQLPVRGIADDALYHQAAAALPDGEWWLLLCPDPDNPRNFNSEGDDSHRRLREAFEEFRGRYIAVGLDPAWNENDNADMQSALVPLPDGRVESGGAY
jgi:hypothetical protein